MTETVPFLQGEIRLLVDNDLVKIKCEGQCVNLTFTSYRSIRKLLKCRKAIRRMFFPGATKYLINKLKLAYYLDDVLIGESNKDIPSSLIGRSLGVKNTKFYFGNLLYHIFNW